MREEVEALGAALEVFELQDVGAGVTGDVRTLAKEKIVSNSD